MSLSDTVGAVTSLSIYAEAALILFFAAFIAVLVRVGRGLVHRDLMLQESRIPLDDSEENWDRVTAHDSPEALRHGQ